MHLLTLFGVPAVGKLTIAKQVAEKSGYTLFHNHLTTDLALSLFKYGEGEFFALMADLRLHCFEAAARGGIRGLVFTCAFAFPKGEEFAAQMIERVKRFGGRCDFVRLTCSDEALILRVGNEDRRAFRKIAEGPHLRETINRYDIHNILSGREALTIDTTTSTPEQSSERIVDFFGIKS